jgi:hypothetical protein
MATGFVVMSGGSLRKNQLANLALFPENKIRLKISLTLFGKIANWLSLEFYLNKLSEAKLPVEN